MKAEQTQRIRAGLRSVRWHALTAAAACFFATATTGCVSQHRENAVIESHFTRLEQTCFGYEPTVWRTMSGQCESAVRQIPEPVIHMPKVSEATPTPATAPSTAPSTEPEDAPLESVPEPGQESGGMGLFRDMMGPPAVPDEDEDAAVPGEGVAVPDEPVPGTKPSADSTPVDPAAAKPPGVDGTSGESVTKPAPIPKAAPAIPPQPDSSAAPPAAPPATQFSFSSARAVKTAPIDTESKPASSQASSGTANALFRTLESALEDAPQPTRVPQGAPKKGPTGLAKFISY